MHKLYCLQSRPIVFTQLRPAYMYVYLIVCNISFAKTYIWLGQYHALRLARMRRAYRTNLRMEY